MSSPILKGALNNFKKIFIMAEFHFSHQKWLLIYKDKKKT